MLNSVIEFILRKTKKKYLIPFVRGLQHLGQPSQVFFPAELLEQGLSLALSGLNNTMAIQSNPEWVWPYWYELQRDPENEAFLPTGMNLVTANLVKRNWTSIGLADSDREAMVDPVGMITPRRYGWSLFPYLKIDGNHFYPPKIGPQVKQYLKNGSETTIITEYHLDSRINWQSEVCTFKYHGEEFALLKVSVHNLTPESIHVDLGVTIRPYNCLTIGHINKLKYKDRVWRINRKPGVILLNEPDSIKIADRHLGDPLQRHRTSMNTLNRTSKSGIVSGLAEYEVELAPMGTHEIEVLLYIKGGSKHSIKWISELTPNEIRQYIQESLHEEKETLDEAMSIQVPDLKIQESYDAVKNHMHVFDDQTHFSPGTFLYHTAWIRDSAFIVMAFHKLGLHHLIDNKMENLLKMQTKEGFFKSQTGEWDSAGQALYTLCMHAKYTGRIDLLKQYFPYLIKGVKWIKKKREFNHKFPTQHEGLLPAGFSAEHFGPNDHYYWDNFWAIAGIKEVIWAAKKLNLIADAAWLEEFHDEYKNDLIESMESSTLKNQGVLPSSPYRSPDSASIGNMIALWPLNLFDVKDEWVKLTQDFLFKNNVYEDMFFQKIIHTGLNAYLTAQLAHVYLDQGNPKAFQLMDGILRWASPTYTWPEAIHPRTGGGCMGDGHHGWAAAEWIGLVHHLFVSEGDNTLYLAPNFPISWFDSQDEIQLKNAFTTYGKISFSLKFQEENWNLKWHFKENTFSDNTQLRLVLPNVKVSDLQTEPFRKHQQMILLKGQSGEISIQVDMKELQYV